MTSVPAAHTSVSSSAPPISAPDTDWAPSRRSNVTGAVSGIQVSARASVRR